MKVLITEEIAKEGIEKLNGAGFEVVQKKLSPEELEKEIFEMDALIVRSSTKVTSKIIEAGEKLKIIGRAGTGFDNIDIEAASKKGIVVKVSPEGNINAVAELTLALMIVISRKVLPAVQKLKENVWKKKEYQGGELKGKNLGIIGCGRIGKRVAEIAEGFNMKILGYDIFANDNNDMTNINFCDLDTLLTGADYVTLHLPKQNVPVIGEKELRKMKKTAYLINTSRGGNVDEKALYETLKEKFIAGAAFDVFEKEGKENEIFFNDLLTLDNFIGVPHLGASTWEAQKETGIQIAEAVIRYLKEGDWQEAVNLGDEITTESKIEPLNILFVFHEDKPGMFRKITEIFEKCKINIVDMSSRRMDDGATTIFKTKERLNANSDFIEQIKKLEGVKRVV